MNRQPFDGDELWHCWFHRSDEPHTDDPRSRHLFKCEANSEQHALWLLMECEPNATRISCVRADDEGNECDRPPIGDDVDYGYGSPRRQ